MAQPASPAPTPDLPLGITGHLPVPLSPLAAPVQDRNALQPYSAVIDGHLLRRLRRQRGLSIDRLAHLAGVDRTTLGRLEREARPRCRMSTLSALARELDVDPVTIAVLVRLGKNDPPGPPPPPETR